MTDVSGNSPPAANGSRFTGMFRALGHRNFRLFFIGQSISLIGTWMQFVAVTWLIWTLTHSPFWLGFVPFISRLPTFLLAPFIGVVVDRLDRHRLVVRTQIAAMIQALVLGGLMLTGWVSLWGLIALQLVLGLINSFDVPARQSLVIQMLDRREDLHNAIALNSSMVNGARLIGPTLAGLLIALVARLWPGRVGFGEGVCVLLNGLSYIGVIGGLLAMRVQPHAKAAAESHPIENLVEGFRYAFGFLPIRSILLLLALVSLMGQSYVNLLPAIASEVLHGGVRTQGYLLSGAGLGALGGAFYLATRTSVRGLGRIIGLAPTVMGLGLIGLGLSPWLWASLAIMPVIGVGMMVQTASSNTILQTIVDDDKRGRVMSFYSLAFMGMVPLGGLLSGALSHGLAAWARWAGAAPGSAASLGVRWTVILGGACCIAGSAWFTRRLPALRALVHPIYVRKGIMPEPPAGSP